MNKDVIYIEPEDDITDIIDRVKSAEQKVVAIVPPKKLGVLRSAVNNKLIAKAAKQSDKAVVMVTADPSLAKIAISAGIPVAKTLQSRPTMPGEPIRPARASEEEEIIEASEDESEDAPAEAPAAPPKKSTTKTTPAEEEIIDSDSIEDDTPKKDSKNNAKKSKKDEKPIPKFEKYRKWIILGSVAGVALICFLVWALVFAPAAKIIVSIKTTATNFSEDISLVSGAAKVDSGIFKLEKQEIKNEDSVEFQATGEKDVGEKAAGSLLAYYYFGTGEKGKTVSIANGTNITFNGLSYTVTKGASLTRSSGTKECDNSDDPDSIADYGCKMSMAIDIQADSSGSNYNVDAGRTGWSAGTAEKFYISNPSAISGGTSKVVKVVQASDVASARQKLEEKSDGNADLKDKLLKQFSEDTYVIDSSYSTSISDPVSSPAVGEEVTSGSAKLSTTATATLYGVDKAAISEYINKVASERLPEDQKIYDIGEPFFEKFSGKDNTFSAKLKTVTHSGPKVTEQEVMEKSKGRKIGEVQTLLRSINGVNNVSVEKSVFWMGSIPDDENKISIEMTVEDQ